ncbi:hypothetical protein GGTG_09874 [Gaeumannomyces tritici R3-111a-1]|uniref:Uncharacterized protein n=1 Tax=Gaeumannomyces tritici (strain R3-111a-1) TaxID=644352 RepID=J3P8N9_GAET3|nr:hypothetical protein GGTG_09874 [Gaeumannomyces tritici R3-111a-1]EJT73023.1 hypothetical protein GGTG_09874 [Gaeumannomyces tritici R3-111a-1]
MSDSASNVGTPSSPKDGTSDAGQDNTWGKSGNLSEKLAALEERQAELNRRIQECPGLEWVIGQVDASRESEKGENPSEKLKALEERREELDRILKALGFEYLVYRVDGHAGPSAGLAGPE